MAGGLGAFMSSPKSAASKLLFQTITCRDQQAHGLREKTHQPFTEKTGLKAVPKALGQWQDSGPHLTPRVNSRTCPAFPESRLFGQALREPDVPLGWNHCAPPPGLCTCWSSLSAGPGSSSMQLAPQAGVSDRPSLAACEFSYSPLFPS
ncbi:hypothetical protein PAL_GLEAN10009266 [Pteropus alecto]|uniref:Uncharacterized protein n=1 Tax=Pteropus alecto TaxID=9402 RepID=L5KWH5_PTEAL|nr:hypothetical protein PAL_GLEAN10009266 [Pteropus alecto]